MYDNDVRTSSPRRSGGLLRRACGVAGAGGFALTLVLSSPGEASTGESYQRCLRSDEDDCAMGTTVALRLGDDDVLGTAPASGG